MAKASLTRPARLAEKLTAIRKALGISQNDFIRRLNLTDELTQAEISAFERGVRVPPLLVLLRIARLTNINLEILVDDSLDLPPELTKEKNAR